MTKTEYSDTPPESRPARTEVLYNESCPICSREIDVYARAARRAGAPVTFMPLGTSDLSAWGLDRDMAARRLYARLPDGRIVSGVAAFLATWDTLPGWRHVARVFRLPGVRHANDLVYDALLAPALYALHRRRERRRTVR